MKAFLKNYRQSPRKVRLIADLIRGKSVVNALETLKFVNKRASEPFAKLIRSAESNAKSQGVDTTSLIVKTITVDKGTVLKRFMPRARGSAAPIRKKSSHVTLTLSSVSPKRKAPKAMKTRKEALAKVA